MMDQIQQQPVNLSNVSNAPTMWTATEATGCLSGSNQGGDGAPQPDDVELVQIQPVPQPIQPVPNVDWNAPHHPTTLLVGFHMNSVAKTHTGWMPPYLEAGAGSSDILNQAQRAVRMTSTKTTKPSAKGGP
jgi:hypothetical protein